MARMDSVNSNTDTKCNKKRMNKRRNPMSSSGCLGSRNFSWRGHRKVVFTDFVWVINRINNHQNIQGGDYWVTNKSDMSWIRLVLIYGTAQIRQKHHLAFDTNSIKLIITSTLMIQFCTNVRIQYSHRTLHYSGKHQNTALNKTSKSLCFFSRG